MMEEQADHTTVINNNGEPPAQETAHTQWEFAINKSMVQDTTQVHEHQEEGTSRTTHTINPTTDTWTSIAATTSIQNDTEEKSTSMIKA